jgi:mannobiose 2-epimerase
MNEKFSQLQDEMSNELENILDYWTRRTTDNDNRGFYGRIDGENQLIAQNPKGSILNSRILWTFSAAYRLKGDPGYLETATRAKVYLLNYFWDKESGGIFWMLDYKGVPIDSKKQIYSLAFSIYALAEFYRATKDVESLDYAIKLFHLIEKYSFDSELNGYLEAFSKDWKLLEDLRLSDKDANEKKTMNTHLHVLEAYTNLYRVWPDELLHKQLKNLIEVFIDKIIDNQTYSFKLFFDEQWVSKSSKISFGHDIEGSWLLYEAADVLKDKVLLSKVEKICLLMAEKVAQNGLDEDGALIYEAEQGKIVDFDKHWWPQAEAIVGFVNTWELTKDDNYLEKALNAWEFTKKKIIDKVNGEWYFRVNRDGIPYQEEDKVGPWKCPYHNGRMCMEIIERYQKMLKKHNL